MTFMKSIPCVSRVDLSALVSYCSYLSDLAGCCMIDETVDILLDTKTSMRP